jgi:hypothetical protein
MRCPAVAGPSDWQARPPDEVQPAPSWLLTRVPEATVLRLASKVALDLPAAPPPLTFEGSAKGSRYCPSYRWANHLRPFDAGQHTRRATSKAATDRAMMTTCIECGEFFPAKRGDACCCSPRCRQAKSRRSERKRSVGNAQEALSTMDRTSARGSPSAALDVTDNRSDHLTLILRPHIEDRNGCRFHSDRFDVYVDGELILTSRQPWHDGARELLRRGYPWQHVAHHPTRRQELRQLRAARDRLPRTVVDLGLRSRRAEAHPLGTHAGRSEAAWSVPVEERVAAVEAVSPGVNEAWLTSALLDAARSSGLPDREARATIRSAAQARRGS